MAGINNIIGEGKGLEVRGLDRNQVRRFWEAANPELLALLDEMERRETWLIDDSQADEILKGLERVIPLFCEQHFVTSLAAPEKAEMLATLVGYIGANQFVAFLMQIEAVREGVIQQVVYALRAGSKDDHSMLADLFLERLRLILQSDLKKHVFSSARIEQVSSIIRIVSEVRANHA